MFECEPTTWLSGSHTRILTCWASAGEDIVGEAERELRDRAAESLAEMPGLLVRSMFSGFGFYLDGVLVAAAWDGAFCLRSWRNGHWMYDPIADELIDEPEALVPLIQEQARAVRLATPPPRR